MMGQLMGALNSGGTPNPNPVSVPNGPLSMNQQGPMPPFLKQTPSAQDGGSTQPQQPAGMTKGAKLATILRSGLQGALAGRAASEQTVAQTGGRRAGGAGTGFEAALMQPYQIAGAQQELAQKKAQTALTQSQSQMVQTPYGMMPPALAKVIFPAQIRAVGAENVQEQKGQTAQNIQQSKSQSAQAVAQTNKRFMAVPNVGLYDTQTRQLLPGSEQGITVTPEIAKDYNLPQEFIGKPLSMQNFGTLERANEFGSVVTEGAAGPALVQRNPTSPNYGQVKPLGLGNPGVAVAQSRPVQVANDPNNPGNVTYATAGSAIKSGAAAPASAPTQTARATARAVAPGGKVGEEINAYNTALQHADLLQGALTALNNGDVRALNSIKNKFQTAFGSSDVTNFQTISSAYSREITKMLSAGHMTDAEIGDAGAKLPSNASPQQILGALQAYRQLAQSKMQQRQQGVQRGMQGQANFPQIQEGATATGPNGHKIRFTQGKWVDAATGQSIQ